MSCVARPYIWHRRNYRGQVIRLAREAYLRPGLVRAQAFRIDALQASHVIICDSATLLTLLPSLESLNIWPDPPVVLLCRSVVEGLAILGDGFQWSSARSLWLRSISMEHQSLLVPIENIFDAEVWKPRHASQTRDHFNSENVISIREALQPLVSKPIVVVDDISVYLTSWQRCDQVLQGLIQPFGDSSISKEAIFPQHWSESKIHLALQKGDVLQGRIKVRKHRQSAVVSCANVDVLVDAVDFNRAINGDVVVVQLIDVSVEVKSIHESAPSSDDDIDFEMDDDLLAENVTELRGRVVGIPQRCWRPYVGTITVEDGETRQPLFVSIDKRVPRIRVATRRTEELFNQKLVVTIDYWHETSRFPDGHIVSYLGESGDVDVEVDAILNEHEIHQKAYIFTDWVDQLPASDWTVSEKDLENRRDFRETHRICSIDPPYINFDVTFFGSACFRGCVDIDDALSVRELINGDIEVGVHIADVTAFLVPESRLDREAQHRSTTVYLSDRRLNMLPEVLSEKICSLHENHDRLAVSVLWTFSKCKGMKVNWIGRSVIRSKYALSYSEAEEIAEAKTPSGSHSSAIEMMTDLKHLRRVGRWLRSERLAKGALEVESFESQFSFDIHDGKPTVDMELHEGLEFHSIVAELMIAANSVVAQKIWECYPTNALLRRHLPPEKHKFSELQQMINVLGGSLDVSSNKSLSESIRNLSFALGDSWTARVVKSFVARCLTEAQYICSAGVPHEQFSHYGLAAEFYTHFTSPIRRYADVIVHRLLLSAIGEKAAELLPSERLAAVCAHLNDRNRSAKLAQRDSSDLFWSLFISFSRGEAFTEAIVTSFSKTKRIGIFIPEFGRKASFGIISDQGQLRLRQSQCQGDIFGTASVHTSGASLQVDATSVNKRFVLRLFDRIVVKVTPHESKNWSTHPRIEMMWNENTSSPVVSRRKEVTIIVPQEVVLLEKNLKVQPPPRPIGEMPVDLSLYYIVNNFPDLNSTRSTKNYDLSKPNFRRNGNRMVFNVVSQPDHVIH